MSDNPDGPDQAQNLRTLGTWLLGIGVVLLLFGLYISAFLIPDVISTASGPQTLSLEEAATIASGERTYAQLENGSWDCETLTYVQGLSPSHRRYGSLEEETKTTEVFFINEPREVIAFVTLSGEVACDELDADGPSGYLYAMSDRTRRELTNDARLARYITAESYLEFCGYCGRDNSMIGAVFGVAFALGGLAMVVYGRRLRRAQPAQPASLDQ